MAVKKKADEVHSPAVVVVNRKASVVMAGAVGTLIDFKSKAEVEKALKDIVKKHKKRSAELIALETFTTAELEEAGKIRADLRDARYTLQRVRDSNKTVLNNMKKNHELTIEELILIVRPDEDKIHAKIVQEEDRKKFEKEEKDRLENERKERIEGRIADAGTEFVKLINDAKKTKDWGLFDAFYSTFESQLDDLEQCAFEGQEVLDDAARKKEEAIAAIEEEERLQCQAEEQAEKDKAQNERQAELDRQAAAAEESKRRVKAMFSIGFLFNGEAFIKGESRYPEADIQEATPEAFDEIVTLWEDQIAAEKKEAEEADAAEKDAREAQEERTENYIKLIDIARGYNLSIVEYTVTNASLVSESQVEDLEAKVRGYETEQGRKVEEERQAELKAEALEIQEHGKVICTAAEILIVELKENVVPGNIQNDKVKSATELFINEISSAYERLKVNTNQNITIE